jgi:uncharacterized membrane protein
MAPDETLPPANAPSTTHRGHFTTISGEDLGRIISLSDGVFAFAMTLLVLSLAVPSFDTTGLSHAQQSSHLAFLLQQDYTAFYGYAFAFVMIAVWWVVHHRTFQYIARYDSALVWLNMAVLMEVAVMPFFLSVFNDYGDTQVAVDLFAGIQVTLGVTLTVLWDYARRAHLLKPKVPEAVLTYFSRRGWGSALIFAVSIGLSFVSITAAELCWILVFITPRFFNRTLDVPPA